MGRGDSAGTRPQEPRSTADPLLHWIELPRASAGTDLLLAPIRATEQEPRRSLAGYIKRLRRERARLERVRLLYVAATRARSALHLLGAVPPPPSAPAEPPAPPRGSLLDILWPAIGRQFLALVPAASAPAAVGAEAAAPSLWRLPPQWSMPPPPADPPWRRLVLGSPAVGDAPEYRWVGSTARAIGTIVHAELHRLSAGVDLPASTAGSTADAGYDAWLAELGVPPDEHRHAPARGCRKRCGARSPIRADAGCSRARTSRRAASGD